MTELEVLVRNGNALTESLRVALRNLANPQLTLFDRREALRQINRCSVELRCYLQLMGQSLSKKDLGKKRRSQLL
jgi:hypothetical protein